jgi:hypothetical protein
LNIARRVMCVVIVKQIRSVKSPKGNVILLETSHHFKAHASILPLREIFQHRPQGFAYTSAAWKTQMLHSYLRSQVEQALKYLEFVVPVH